MCSHVMIACCITFCSGNVSSCDYTGKNSASCFTEFSKNKLKFLNKGGTFLKKHCGAASVGVLQDNLVLSTELTM